MHLHANFYCGFAMQASCILGMFGNLEAASSIVAYQGQEICERNRSISRMNVIQADFMRGDGIRIQAPVR